MATGRVLSWNRTYGFITDDESGTSVFTHFSEILAPGFKELTEGQRVTYEIVNTPKGPRATNVIPH